MRIPRIHDDLTPHLRPNKVLVLYRPRQAGKTTLVRLKEYCAGYDLIVADEVQRAKNIGQVSEPLAGRKTTLLLYPVAQLELLAQFSSFDLQRKLEEYLIFGSYPEVLFSDRKEEKVRLENELTGSFLLKDILELGRQLGFDGKTVGRYLDLLEKAFVLFNLRGFNRNLRNDTGQLWENYLPFVGKD